MLRVKLAAKLLKSAGAEVEFRVKRAGPVSGRAKDGRTLLRTPNYKRAVEKLNNLRVADTDTCTVQLVATTNTRHATSN